MSTVSIKISNTQIDVPWVSGNNIQYYLEQARDQVATTPQKFDFALQYYGHENGTYYGYIIIMMLDDQHFDNYNNNGYYWEYLINGNFAPLGIDLEYPKAGDKLEFQYNQVNKAQPSTQGTATKLAAHH